MGWRQLDLARATGVALSTLKRFEARGEVGFDVVVRVAIALGVEKEFTTLFPPYEAASLDEVIAKNRRPMRARRRS